MTPDGKANVLLEEANWHFHCGNIGKALDALKKITYIDQVSREIQGYCKDLVKMIISIFTDIKKDYQTELDALKSSEATNGCRMRGKYGLTVEKLKSHISDIENLIKSAQHFLDNIPGNSR